MEAVTRHGRPHAAARTHPDAPWTRSRVRAAHGASGANACRHRTPRFTKTTSAAGARLPALVEQLLAEVSRQTAQRFHGTCLSRPLNPPTPDLGEFDLVAYFSAPRSPMLPLGGDDCVPCWPRASGMQLPSSSDMLVEAVTFADARPRGPGPQGLAVNLSDLAVYGARPLAFTLATLALPRVDEVWLAGFSKGLLALADEYGCELVAATPRRAR